MSEPEPLPAIGALKEFRERYTNRRTVAYDMLVQAETLIRTGIAEQRRDHRAEIQALTRAHEEVERGHAREVARLEQSIEHERRMRAQAEETAATIRAHNSALREEQENIEDGTLVKIVKPKAFGRAIEREWHLGGFSSITVLVFLALGPLACYFLLTFLK